MKKSLKKIKKNSPTLPRTFGQRAADGIAKWAGSWVFILSFLLLLIIWMGMNIYMWVGEWDPYPFILLNLVLSCIAAIQAPIILMSQNRSGEKDRQRFEYDYAVNRKAEREIREMKNQLERIEKIVTKKPHKKK